MSEPCQRCGTEHGAGRCSAHKKRHDTSLPLEPCGNWKALGTDVCRMHGAKSLRGPANPNFKTGKFSDVLPAGWAEQADRLAADPTLLELREHISLVDTMIREELRRLATKGRPEVVVADAQRAIRALDRATASRDGLAAQAAYARLKETIVELDTMEKSRTEFHRLVELRRRLNETEQKRIEKMKAFVTVEQLTVLAYRYVDLAAEMAEGIAVETARLIADRQGKLRQVLVAELLPLATNAADVDELVSRVVGVFDLAGDVKAVGNRNLSDLAARLQEIGEAEGASDVDEDELAN